MSEYKTPEMDYARIIPVIETTLARRGTGKEDSPIRIIKQYWLTDGTLLMEVDTWQGALR